MKDEKIRESEYSRLNELITHFLARQKKEKKKQQAAVDLKEHKHVK